MFYQMLKEGLIYKHQQDCISSVDVSMSMCSISGLEIKC
jgi:hypothetical protein